MRFDDRLRTVLSHPADGEHARAVRWRQLVDLIARGDPLGASAFAAEALELIEADAPLVDEDLRAAAARAVAALPLPVELVRIFAQDSLKVSAPVLAAAELSSEQWELVKSAAREDTARFIEALHPAETPEPADEFELGPSSTGAEAFPTPTIKEVIDRIEAIRSARAPAPDFSLRRVEPAFIPAPNAPPALAAKNDEKGLFEWECGPSGEVEWVEGAPRAALIGRPLIEAGDDRDSGSGEIARAFALRAPFSNAVLSLAEGTPLAGEWELSGMPAFDHISGRFAGYRGIARRARRQTRSSEPSPAPHPDTLRELVHEIKTPLNAIMGFAQIIQGQMFGPASSSYRGRAAEIVAQSNLLLMAIDDLDLAAKLQAGTFEDGRQTDLALVLEEVTPGLEQKAQDAGVELRTLVEPHLPPCEVSPAVVERLLQRLIGGLIDCSEPGEPISLTASQSKDRCTVTVDRPLALGGLGEDDLLDPGFASLGQRNARLSLGFSLRLVRGIAQLAGGDLTVSRTKLTLLLGRGDLRPPESGRYRRSAGAGPVAQR